MIAVIDALRDPRWGQVVALRHGDFFHSPPWISAVAATCGFRIEAAVLPDHLDRPAGGILYFRIDDVLGPRIVSAPFLDACDPLVAAREDWARLAGRILDLGLPVIMRGLADDQLAPGKPRIQVKVARRFPATDAIICDGTAFNGELELKPHMPGRAALDASLAGKATGDFHCDMITGRECAGVAAQVLFPRRILERVGLFVELLCQDTEYWLRVARVSLLTFHRRQLVRHREHRSGLSGSTDVRYLRYRRGWLETPVAHRHRRPGVERRLIDHQVERITRELVYSYCIKGRNGERLKAGRLIVELFRYLLWQLLILIYPAGIRAPAFVHRVCAVRRCIHRAG